MINKPKKKKKISGKKATILKKLILQDTKKMKTTIMK